MAWNSQTTQRARVARRRPVPRSQRGEQPLVRGRIEPRLSPLAAARRMRQTRAVRVDRPDRATAAAWLLIAAVGAVMVLVALFPE